MVPANATIHWGSDVVGRTTGVPYLVYEPRPTSLLQLLDESLRWSGREAFVHAGERVTYDELNRLAKRGAADLVASGVGTHDRVLLLGANTIG